MDTLGKMIKRHRRRRNISPGQLADVLGVNRHSVYNWESDVSTPPLPRFMELARILLMDPAAACQVIPTPRADQYLAAERSRIIKQLDDLENVK